ncbi:hypothetical protein L1987_15118 [Smallanthus sonchifolius]|uniref:Uncharacterized protein n=1 Tax=Smallanthus sonchifolius TaxID=185202 RepID=A0ACB9J796_9ASTR|nr:hypothetical protein L1987_15118 [Smallanthus sonchifolius]
MLTLLLLVMGFGIESLRRLPDFMLKQVSLSNNKDYWSWSLDGSVEFKHIILGPDLIRYDRGPLVYKEKHNRQPFSFKNHTHPQNPRFEICSCCFGSRLSYIRSKS